MAVYAIGAYYSRRGDVSEEFVKNGVACIGYSEERAPGLYEQLSKIKAGDVIFIKSWVPQSGLHIKAVGIVVNPHVCPHETLGSCIGVRWAWSGEWVTGRLADRGDNLRVGTLYEEFNPKVVRRCRPWFPAGGLLASWGRGDRGAKRRFRVREGSRDSSKAWVILRRLPRAAVGRPDAGGLEALDERQVLALASAASPEALAAG